ncbi:MAG: Hsp20/alpha crystallin family protein [Intestinimonas sp.]|jgi:HSP20 family protein|nr:Hsp20/alpha crystallin family protein [Intestinimonas sp.]
MFGMLPFERQDNNLFDTFDHFARDFFRSTNTNLPAFRTDIQDKGDSFLLEAELPGFEKEDISLDLKENVLTISAEHKEQKEEKDSEGNYIRRERRYGSYTRSFDISGIDESNITATYENGILSLILPKEQPAVPETHRIAIQ